jgi:putative endonuclease
MVFALVDLGYYALLFNSWEILVENAWFVYIVRCSDSTLYTGITTDLERRMDEHNSHKKGARYTRTRRPVRLVYCEKVSSRSAAASREYAIKKMTLAEKCGLIENDKGDL